MVARAQLTGAPPGCTEITDFGVGEILLRQTRVTLDDEAKVRRLAYLETPGLVSGQPSREHATPLGYSKLYGQSGNRGVLEQIWSTWPGMAEVVLGYTGTAAAAEWEIVPPDDASPLDRQFVTDAHTILSEMRSMVPEGVGGIEMLRSQIAMARWMGHAYWEASWYDDPGAHLGKRLEVFHVHQSSVQSVWVDTLAGRIARLDQWTEIGGAKIDGDKLLHVSFGPGWPTGFALLRPFVFLFEITKDRILAESALAKNSAGVIILRQSQPNTDGRELAASRGNYIAQVENRGDLTILSLPYGQEHEFQMPPSGTAPGSLEWIEWFDKVAARIAGRLLRTMPDASTGNRALGETVSESEDAESMAAHDQEARAFGRRFFPWLARQLRFRGYSDLAGRLLVRLPTMTVRPKPATINEATSFERGVALVEKGIWAATPRVSRWLGELAGAPEDVIEDQAREEETPTVSQATPGMDPTA